MITFDSPRIQRFGSAASRRGATVVDQATATSFCAPPRPPAGTRPPGAGDSGSGADPESAYNYEADLRASDAAEYARTHPAPAPRPATPPPAPAPIASPPPGPAENSGTMAATLLALGVVGGLFLWVTSGPQMARANPEEPWWLKYLRSDARQIIEKYDANGSMTEWKPGKSGGIVISGVSVAHSPRMMRELESVATEHGMVLDKVPTHKDMEFGLTTLVFTPKSTYRFNPRGLRYDERKGLWTGANERALYHVSDPRAYAQAAQILPGWQLKSVGPNVDIRLATRAEANAAGWPAGWIVAEARENPHQPRATPLPGASPLATFRNNDLGLESYVFAGSRGYNVTLRDLDSGESVPLGYVNIVSWNDALAKARKAANVSSDTAPHKPGT